MEISNMELADEPYAVRIASMILGSFMQQPPDTKAMLRLLTRMLIGVPKLVLNRMVDPTMGVASKNEFFSLAACKKWIDGQKECEPFNRAEHRLLPPPAEKPISEEERARRVNMLEGVKAELAKITHSNVVGGDDEPETATERRQRGMLERTQRHDPEALLMALENLEQVKRKNDKLAE